MALLKPKVSRAGWCACPPRAIAPEARSEGPDHRRCRRSSLARARPRLRPFGRSFGPQRRRCAQARGQAIGVGDALNEQHLFPATPRAPIFIWSQMRSTSRSCRRARPRKERIFPEFASTLRALIGQPSTRISMPRSFHFSGGICRVSTSRSSHFWTYKDGGEPKGRYSKSAKPLLTNVCAVPKSAKRR